MSNTKKGQVPYPRTKRGVSSSRKAEKKHLSEKKIRAGEKVTQALEEAIAAKYSVKELSREVREGSQRIVDALREVADAVYSLRPAEPALLEVKEEDREAQHEEQHETEEVHDGDV